MKADSATLAGKTAGAGVWTVGTKLASKLIDLGILLCLARFLGPAEFGLIAVAMAVVVIVEALFELPIAAALIRVQFLTPAMLHTAFTLGVMRGLFIASVLIILSWPLAIFSSEPRLTLLVSVLALAPAARGLASPRMVEFARVFNFRPDAALELFGKLTALIVSISVAVLTRSYWAIAAATICGPLASTTLSYFMAPLKPKLTLSQWALFSNIVGWNFFSQLGSALNWQIDRLLLPRLTTVIAFGHYTMGKQISEIPVQALIQPLVRPTMAALSIAGERRGARYLQLSHGIALVMVPVMGVPILWPDIIIRLALGLSWLPAAQWLRWISVSSMLVLPAILMASLTMTLDRTRWLAVRTYIELAVRLPLVWFGASFVGIGGAIAGSAVATLVGTIAGLFVVKKLAYISVLDQLKVLWTPIAAILPSAAVLYVYRPIVMNAEGVGGILVLMTLPLATYFSIYVVLIGIAWVLSGRPSGVERHLFEVISRSFNRTAV